MNDLVRLGAALPALERSDRALLAAAEAMYGAVLSELERSPSIERLVDIHHGALAAEHYVLRWLQSRVMKLRAQNFLAEARLRLEREIGKWLRENVRHGGDRRSESRLNDATLVGRLPEGVSRSDSSRWQQIALVPDTVFEHYVVTTRDRGREITTKAVLKLAGAVVRRDRDRRPSAGHQGGTAEDLARLVASGQRFGCILADPPWPYRNTRSNGAAANHYDVMSIEETAALPVRELSAENAHLHLWTTSEFLFEARAVLEAWGFAYKGLFVWLKEEAGTGNYWRSAAEFLLLGVRGNCPFLDHSQRNWLLTQRGRHGEKPEEVRLLIERVSPGPRLELFARRAFAGWTVWGNEIGGNDEESNR